MKKELEDKIFKKFTTLFPNGRNVDPKKSLVCFGLECDDGWYNLISELCENLKFYQDSYPDKINIVVKQVKEKFGGLRFYVSGTDEVSQALIRKAEENSYKICEECGKEGSLDESLPRIKTLCEKHKKDRKLDFEKRTNLWKKKRKQK